MNNTAKLTIHAVGDVMLGEGPYYLDRGVRTAILKKGFQHPFEKISDLLGSADLVIGNLEVACSTLGESSSLRSRTFRGPDDGAAALNYGGFTAMTLANNHFLSHGTEVAADSYRHLKDAGIKTVGWNPKKLGEVEAAVELITVKGHKIALIALCDVHTKLPDETKKNEFPSIYEPWVIDSIYEFKNKGCLIIINVHWGDQYIDRPNPSHVSLARDWVDHGADLVLGHGPHVIQGYEMRRGRPIIYSMGNFIFDQHFSWDTSASAIFQIETDCRHFHLSIIPVKYNQFYQVLMLDGEGKNYVQNVLDERSLKISAAAVNMSNTDKESYQTEARKAYQQMQANYLRYMIKTVPNLTIRSSLALLRDMWARLYDFFRFTYRLRDH